MHVEGRDVDGIYLPLIEARVKMEMGESFQQMCRISRFVSSGRGSPELAGGRNAFGLVLEREPTSSFLASIAPKSHTRRAFGID